MVPFESFGTVCYSYSIVTMALSCIISEIKRHIGEKLRYFHIPPAFDVHVKEVPVGILTNVWYGMI